MKPLEAKIITKTDSTYIMVNAKFLFKADYIITFDKLFIFRAL